MSFEKLYKKQMEEWKGKYECLMNLLDEIEEIADENVKKLIEEYKRKEYEELDYIRFNPRDMKVTYYVSDKYGRIDIFVKEKHSQSEGVPHIMDFESREDANKIAYYLNNGIMKMVGSYLLTEIGRIEL